jgi:hypothetical protein
MPNRVQRGQVREIPVDLGDGDIVTIKERKTVRDTAAINAATVEGKIMSSQDGKVVEMGRMDLGAPVVQTLIQMVTGWSGPGFCRVDHDDLKKQGAKFEEKHEHRPLDLTPQNLAGMFDEDAQKVLAVIEEKNPRPQRGSGKENSKNSTAAA